MSGVPSRRDGAGPPARRCAPLMYALLQTSVSGAVVFDRFAERRRRRRGRTRGNASERERDVRRGVFRVNIWDGFGRARTTAGRPQSSRLGTDKWRSGRGPTVSRRRSVLCRTHNVANRRKRRNAAFRSFGRDPSSQPRTANQPEYPSSMESKHT